MTALIDLYGLTRHDDLARIVAAEYGLLDGERHLNPHRLRRERIAQRLRLYRDDALVDFERVIDAVFETETVRAQRKKMIVVASEQNITRRIVDEVASLYDKPALRILMSREDEFAKEEQRLNLHEVMQEQHRLAFLCNAVLLWRFAGVDGTRLRIVTPDIFDAIPDSRDKNVPAGFLIDAAPSPLAARAPGGEKLPRYEIWDDTYQYLINTSGAIVNANGDIAEPTKHGFGRIPGVLLHRREPVDMILDDRHGRDITSAHLGCGLLNVMIMRLSKSQGERQPILQGNLANAASGQSMDGERPIILPPEVIASMLDTQTSPEHYLSVKKDKLGAVASTYGMSYELITGGDDGSSASGKAYQVRREKLTELRQEQRRRAVRNERDVVALMGFDPDGMRMDYQEQAIPADAAEKVALLEAKQRLGLDSAVAYLMREDPDLSRDAATALLVSNFRDWARLIDMQRRLNAPADAGVNGPGQSPEKNGADNAPKDVPPEAPTGQPAA